MKLKKLNAALALLAILCILLHVGYSAFAYLTFYYNPVLKNLFAVPFLVLTCLHAVLGMTIVFTQKDGSRMDLYPKQNRRTILQRTSAALIFPLLILHMKTFALMQAAAEGGQTLVILLLIAAELLFFAVVLTHAATSFSKAFITLGLLTSERTAEAVDKACYVIGAVLFLIPAFAVVKGQIAMFLMH